MLESLRKIAIGTFWYNTCNWLQTQYNWQLCFLKNAICNNIFIKYIYKSLFVFSWEYLTSSIWRGCVSTIFSNVVKPAFTNIVDIVKPKREQQQSISHVICVLMKSIIYAWASEDSYPLFPVVLKHTSNFPKFYEWKLSFFKSVTMMIWLMHRLICVLSFNLYILTYSESINFDIYFVP